MNVVHIHHRYYLIVRDLERVIQDLAEELVKLGHEFMFSQVVLVLVGVVQLVGAEPETTRSSSGREV
jgi:predicted transcriptional regulator